MNLRVAVLVILFCPSLAAAQTADSAPPAPAPVRIDVPLIDAPYNTGHGYRAPSMAQSLALAEGFYELTHQGIQRAWGTHSWLSRFSIIGADLLGTLIVPLPGSDGWLHEEFHRAVMGRRGVDSFNDVYRFRINADAIAVSRVSDADLVRLKRDHPAEQARLSSAGLEGEYLLVQRLQENQFFRRSPAWHQPLYWLEKIGSAAYVSSGAWAETDAETDAMNAREGADVSIRDFTGHDFTAWVYDLFRPDEPYTARGVHPSSVGIDRYIKPSDLTPEELTYLKHQGRLQLLNFVDPFLVGVKGFTVNVHGRPVRFNANLGHLLTPFGRTVDTNVFVASGNMNLLLTVHAYANDGHTFPGIDAKLLDYPVTVRGRAIRVTPRVAFWQQPADQRFRADAGSAGGLVAIKMQGGGTRRVGAFAEIEAKSAGWVAGNVALGRNVSARVGVSVKLY